MTVFVAFLLIVGAGSPNLNGYGTWTDFCDRRRRARRLACCCSSSGGSVQDGEKMHLREETPTMPEEGEWPTGFEADARSLTRRPDPATDVPNPYASASGTRSPKERT